MSLLDKTGSCLHMGKGSLVFVWCVFISVLEVHVGEAVCHYISRAASPDGTGGWHPFVAVLCAEGPLCCLLDIHILG